jgi:hypothetical protein
MKLKALFIANTIVSVPFGIGSVLAPHLFLSLFGATLNPAGALMMQYGGAWLIGLGLLTWLTRNAADSGMGGASPWPSSSPTWSPLSCRCSGSLPAR